MTGSQFIAIRCSVDIELDTDIAWSRIGGFADAGHFLNVPCELIAGDGEIGSVRLVGDIIQEVMVGRAAHSYTYAQTVGPMAPYAYHGCMALFDDGPGRSRLDYTILYDQANMDDDQRERESVRIKARFQGAAEAMKRGAEKGAPTRPRR